MSLQRSSGAINIIGPRYAGKTTYLASLAYLSEISPQKPIKAIEPINNDAQELRQDANNILKQGSLLAPTKTTDHYKRNYFFGITISAYFGPELFNSLLKDGEEKFTLCCKDYAGELFQSLPSNPDEGFLDDCLVATGLLVLIDGTSLSQQDNEYFDSLNVLRKELSSRLNSTEEYRIAIVLSKADQHRLWNSLKNLKDFFAINFPRTHDLLEEWNQESKFSISYFACSAYGMIGDSFQLNAESISDYVFILRSASSWKPFGLINPIYWLATGKIHPRLQSFKVGKKPSFKKPVVITALILLLLGSIGTFATFLFTRRGEKTPEQTPEQPPEICQQVRENEEQQYSELKKLFQSNDIIDKALHQDCTNMFDNLLLNTGIKQASQDRVPRAVDRFCKISRTSREEINTAQIYLERWIGDNYWQSIVKQQLTQKQDCPAAEGLNY